MNRLSLSRRAEILHHLVEGVSVNATQRMTGASKVTILKLLNEVGPACEKFQNEIFRNLTCKRLQVDEMWSFVGCKQIRVPVDQRGRGRGDAWIWSAIDADTKLIPVWHVGARDAEAARLFLEDLASRLTNRPQLTSDGLRVYVDAVDSAFGTEVDYAMLVKVYGPAPEGQRRYSPSEFVSAEKWAVTGNPDLAHVSTSFVERSNLTARMNVRRLTRLTNGFSKKLENHQHAMALHFCFYNFARRHETLTKAARGVHTTPAMAAGLTNRVWTMTDIARLAD